MSEWNEIARKEKPEGTEALSEPWTAEGPRRRRRADRYQQEEAAPAQPRPHARPALQDSSETAREVARRYQQEEAAPVQPRPQARPALQDSSETAREVANRYREREQRPPEGDTTRVKVQNGRMPAGEYAARTPQRPSAERVGYPSGRMGGEAQRARMSAEGRARLAEENQMRAGQFPERGNLPRGGQETGLPRDPRYAGRPPVNNRDAAGQGRSHKGLTAVVVALLVVGVLLVGLLAAPEDGPLGAVKSSLRALTGGREETQARVFSFAVDGEAQVEAPAEIDFLAVTDKGISGLRLLDEYGNILPAESVKLEGEEEIRWTLSWYAEEPFSGPVLLQMLSGEKWADTGAQTEVNVLEASPVATAEVLPEVVATETPAPTPVPTATPAPTPEEDGLIVEEETEPEADPGESAEEAEEAMPLLPAGVDPDDPEAGKVPAEEAAAPLRAETAKTEDAAESVRVEPAAKAAETGNAAELAAEKANTGDATETAEKADTGDAAVSAAEKANSGDTEEPLTVDPATAAAAAAAVPQEQPEESPAAASLEAAESAEQSAGSESARAEGGEAAPAGEKKAEEEAAPEKVIFPVQAAEDADPSLIAQTVIYNGNNKKKVAEYARSDREKVHMPTLGEYTKQKMGVLTFRTDAFRQNGAVGTVKGMDSLEVAWKAEAGSIKGAGQTYYGVGWVGQPAIVKWSKEVREQSEMYDAKKEKSGLKEVIVGGLDGRIYFLDLSDGSATRNSVKLGFPMKAAPSVHPGGAPYMNVGQFARKMAGKTGTIGIRQYNLYMLKELSLIDGLDGKNNRPYNTVGSFETSALIDRTTGTMLTAGTNGMLYMINLNSEFDYNAGTYTQSPTTVVMKSKAKNESDSQTAVEASIAMYDRYVYYADMGGFLRCVDTNSLKTLWAVALGDAVESTPALDWHGENGLDLYAATELTSRKKGEAEIFCLDALSGEKRWTAGFGVKKDTKNKTVSGFRASPVVGQNALQDYVYYTVNNLSEEGQSKLGLASEDAALIALRKEDGSVVWAHGLGGNGYSSPVAVYDENGNGAIIQCAGDGSVLMLDGETGETRAMLQIDGTIEASPAVFDGMMVVGTTERNKNNIYGIRIE